MAKNLTETFEIFQIKVVDFDIEMLWSKFIQIKWNSCVGCSFNLQSQLAP